MPRSRFILGGAIKWGCFLLTITLRVVKEEEIEKQREEGGRDGGLEDARGKHRRPGSLVTEREKFQGRSPESRWNGAGCDTATNP